MRKARRIKLMLEFECPATDLNQDPIKAVKRYVTLKPGAKLLDSRIEDHEIVERESSVNMNARRYNEYLRVINLAAEQAGLKGAVNIHGGGWARYYQAYTYYIKLPDVPGSGSHAPDLVLQTVRNEACFKVQDGLVAKGLGISDKIINLAHPDSLTQISDMMKQFIAFDSSTTACKTCKRLWFQHEESCSQSPYYTYWKQKHPSE